MNTKGLEAMVPKMIDEAEDYFKAWGDEGEVELRQVLYPPPSTLHATLSYRHASRRVVLPLIPIPPAARVAPPSPRTRRSSPS